MFTMGNSLQNEEKVNVPNILWIPVQLRKPFFICCICLMQCLFRWVVVMVWYGMVWNGMEAFLYTEGIQLTAAHSGGRCTDLTQLLIVDTQ